MSRVNYQEVAPNVVKLLMQQEKYLKETRIDKKLMNLIKIRASQINKCAFCIHMHTNEALRAGETIERISCLVAWRDTELYTEEERVALALTEAVTDISKNGVSDNMYQEVSTYYNETEIIDMVMLIININSWNRLSIMNKNIVQL